MSLVRQFLTLYTVRAKKYRAREYLNFEDISDKTSNNNEDIFTVLEKFTTWINRNGGHLDNDQKVLTEMKNVQSKPTNRHVYGLIYSGAWGENGQRKNITTKKTKKFTENDATQYPYYFNFFLPTLGNRGLLALHSRGKFGCKTSLQNALNEYVNDIGLSYSIQLNPLTLDFKTNWTAFSKSSFRVKKINATTFMPLRNEDKLIKGQKSSEEKVTVEQIVHVGRNGGSLFDPRDLAKKENPLKITSAAFKRYIEIKDVENETRLKVTVEMGGQEKTMDVSGQMDFHLSYDITEEFKNYTRSKPTLHKLHDVCEEYITHAKDKIT